MPSIDFWRHGSYDPSYLSSTKEPNKLRGLLGTAVTVVLGVPVAIFAVNMWFIAALAVTGGALSLLTSFAVLFWGYVDRSQAEQMAASLLFLGAFALCRCRNVRRTSIRPRWLRERIRHRNELGETKKETSAHVSQTSGCFLLVKLRVYTPFGCVEP